MILSHSSAQNLIDRIDALEQKVDLLISLLTTGEHESSVPAYSIKQAALEVGCSVYVLKKLFDFTDVPVARPVRGTRYSRSDIAKLKEAYAKLKSAAYRTNIVQKS